MSGTTTHTEPARRLAEVLVEMSGYLQTVATHVVALQMQGRGAEDAQPIPEVMRNLLAGILEEVERECGRPKLTSTAKVLESALRHAEDDIYYLDPEDDKPF